MMSDRSATRIEFARRSVDGVDVTLVWLQGVRASATIVCIRDTWEGGYFEIPTAWCLTLNVYYDPFAYRDFSRGGVDDDCLVA